MVLFALLANHKFNGPFAFKNHTIDGHFGFGEQVFAVQYRMQIGLRRAAPFAAANGVLIARKPFLLATVKILGKRKTCLLARLDKHIHQNVVCAFRFLHGQRAVSAVKLGIAVTAEILSAPEIRQHAFIRPALIAQLAPMVIIPCIAANINHRIDGRRAAPTASPRPVHLTTIHIIFRLGFKPVILFVLLGNNLRISCGHVNKNILVAFARFEQKNRGVFVLRQTVRQNAACATGTDDDVIYIFNHLLKLPSVFL